MDLAERAAEQVSLWEKLIFRTLIQQALIIEQMLEPSYFQDDITTYPLEWDQAINYDWQELEADPDAIETVYWDDRVGYWITTKYVSHVSTENRPDSMVNFEKILGNLTSLWN